MHYNQKTYTVNDALKQLQKYCAYQERCHQEVHQKLKSMRMIPEAIDHIIVALIQDNFLNEARFAQSFVRGKFRMKHWGRQRLRLELKKRDISRLLIDKALNEIEESDYLESLDTLARKKVALISETNVMKKRKKLADYLLYRGWESHLVFEKVHELIPS